MTSASHIVKITKTNGCFCAVATYAPNKNTRPAVHKVKHVTAGVKDRSSVSPRLRVTTGLPPFPPPLELYHWDFLSQRFRRGAVTPPLNPSTPRCGDMASDPCVLNLIPDIFPLSLCAAVDIVEASPRTIWWNPLPERRPGEIFHCLRPRRVEPGSVVHPLLFHHLGGESACRTRSAPALLLF